MFVTAALTTGLARASMELVDDVKYRFKTEFGHGVVWDVDANWPKSIVDAPYMIAAQEEMNRLANYQLDNLRRVIVRGRQMGKTRFADKVYGPLLTPKT